MCWLPFPWVQKLERLNDELNLANASAQMSEERLLASEDLVEQLQAQLGAASSSEVGAGSAYAPGVV